MTPHLPAVTADEVVKVAKLLGFRFHRQRGGHAVYYREKDKSRLVVPMHAGKTIKPKTLQGMLSDLGLSADEFRDLLQP